MKISCYKNWKRGLVFRGPDASLPPQPSASENPEKKAGENDEFVKKRRYLNVEEGLLEVDGAQTTEEKEAQDAVDRIAGERKEVDKKRDAYFEVVHKMYYDGVKANADNVRMAQYVRQVALAYRDLVSSYQAVIQIQEEAKDPDFVRKLAGDLLKIEVPVIQTREIRETREAKKGEPTMAKIDLMDLPNAAQIDMRDTSKSARAMRRASKTEVYKTYYKTRYETEMVNQTFEIPKNAEEYQVLQNGAAMAVTGARASLFLLTGNMYEKEYLQDVEQRNTNFATNGATALERAKKTDSKGLSGRFTDGVQGALEMNQKEDIDEKSKQVEEYFALIASKQLQIEKDRLTNPLKAFASANQLYVELDNLRKDISGSPVDKKMAGLPTDVLSKTMDAKFFRELKKSSPKVFQRFSQLVDISYGKAANLARGILGSVHTFDPEIARFKQNMDGFVKSGKGLFKTFENLAQDMQNGETPSKPYMAKIHEDLERYINSPYFQNIDKIWPHHQYRAYLAADLGAFPGAKNMIKGWDQNHNAVEECKAKIFEIAEELKDIGGDNVGLLGLLKDIGKFALVVAACVATYGVMGAIGASTFTTISTISAVSTLGNASLDYLDGNGKALDPLALLEGFAQSMVVSALSGVVSKPTGTRWGNFAKRMNDRMAKSEIEWVRKFAERGYAARLMQGQEESLFKAFISELGEETLEEGMQRLGQAIAPKYPFIGFMFQFLGTSAKVARGVFRKGKFQIRNTLRGEVTDTGVKLEYVNIEEASKFLKERGLDAESIGKLEKEGSLVIEKDGMRLEVGRVGEEEIRKGVDPKNILHEDSYFEDGEKKGKGSVLLQGNEGILYSKQFHFSSNIQKMYEVIMKIVMNYSGRLDQLTEDKYREEINARMTEALMPNKRGHPDVAQLRSRALEYYNVIIRNNGVPSVSGYFSDGKLYVSEGNHRARAALAVGYPLVMEFKREKVDQPGWFKKYPKIETTSVIQEGDEEFVQPDNSKREEMKIGAIKEKEKIERLREVMRNLWVPGYSTVGHGTAQEVVQSIMKEGLESRSFLLGSSALPIFNEHENYDAEPDSTFQKILHWPHLGLKYIVIIQIPNPPKGQGGSSYFNRVLEASKGGRVVDGSYVVSPKFIRGYIDVDNLRFIENDKYDSTVKVRQDSEFMKKAKEDPAQFLEDAWRLKNGPPAEKNPKDSDFKEALEFAVREVVSQSPLEALRLYGAYEDQPYFAEVFEMAMRSAAEKDYSSLLLVLPRYRKLSLPYFSEVMEIVVRKVLLKAPWRVFVSAKDFKDQPYAEALIREAAEKYPAAAIVNFDEYKDEPYAEAVLRKAVEKSPGIAFDYIHLFKDKPYAEDILRIAREKDPVAAEKYQEKLRDKDKSPIISLEIFKPHEVKEEEPPEGCAFLYRGVKGKWAKPSLSNAEYDSLRKEMPEGWAKKLKTEGDQYFSDSLEVAKHYAGKDGEVVRVAVKGKEVIKYIQPTGPVSGGIIATNFALPPEIFLGLGNVHAQNDKYDSTAKEDGVNLPNEADIKAADDAYYSKQKEIFYEIVLRINTFRENQKLRKFIELSSKQLLSINLRENGIVEPEEVADFNELLRLRVLEEKATMDLKALKRARLLIRITPELSDAYDLEEFNLNGFIQKFNKRYPEGFRDRRFSIIRKLDNGVLAFNQNGELQIFPNKESVDQLRENDKTITSIIRVSNLTDFREGQLNENIILEAFKDLRAIYETSLFVKKPVVIKYGLGKDLNVKHHGEFLFVIVYDAMGEEVGKIYWPPSRSQNEALVCGAGLFSIKSDFVPQGSGAGRAFIEAKIKFAKAIGYKYLDIIPDNRSFWAKIFAEESGRDPKEIDKIIYNTSGRSVAETTFGRWYKADPDATGLHDWHKDETWRIDLIVSKDAYRAVYDEIQHPALFSALKPEITSGKISPEAIRKIHELFRKPADPTKTGAENLADLAQAIVEASDGALDLKRAQELLPGVMGGFGG